MQSLGVTYQYEILLYCRTLMFAQILPGVKYQVALVISKRLQIRTLPYVAVTSQLISDTLQTDIKCH